MSDGIEETVAAVDAEKQENGTQNAPPRAKKPRKYTPAAAKKPRPPAHKTAVKGYKYDWFEIKSAFIEGIPQEGTDERLFVNLVELSERLDVPLQRIRERAADERWYDQREQYQLRIAKARQTKRVLELAGESVDFDSKSLELAKLGIGMVTARMAEIAREVKEAQIRREEALKLQATGFAVDPEDLKTVIDARELDTLSRAATQWQQLGHKAMGTDITRMEVQHEVQGSIDIDVEVTSISAELGRDDPERLAAFLQAAKRAGLLDTVMDSEEPDSVQLSIEAGDDADIVDAVLVEQGEADVPR